MPLGFNTDKQQEDKKKQDPFGVAAFAPAGAPDTPGQAGASWAPSVNVTPTVSAGTIRDTGGLQFNADYAQRVNNLDRGIYDAQMARHAAITNAQAGQQRQLLDAAEMQDKARQALLQRMAGTGMLRSSNAADKSTELEGNYAKFQQDLSSDLAGRISQAEAAFVNAVNQVALQKEGLFSQQQQEEQARRLAAEQAAAQQAAQQQAMAAQQAILDSIANQPAPVINIAPPPSIGYSGGGGGGGYSAPQPATPQGPDWTAPAMDWNSLVNWANTMRRNYSQAGSGFAGFSADMSDLFNRDPRAAGSYMNSMGTYYGGANNLQEVLGWLFNPIQKPTNSGVNTNFGVL